jgi:hypothetical protein
MEVDATWKCIRREADVVASVYDPEVFARLSDGVLAWARADSAIALPG